ncbi:Extra-cytoplasmic solute receptor [Cupriavidus necator]|uniref:Bug family tripartite tricarboxylate transporter substrate binding protein n=1 Tax=Cupriavidus necator TaxID=106590 RepID=UPI003F73B31B
MKKGMTAAFLLMCGVMAGTSAAHAETTWPTKPIRLVIPFPPGGGTDILSRIVANEVSQNTKWTFVPDNKPGAGGTIGISDVVKAAPTGYDIVMGQKDNVVVAPWVNKAVTYDPRKDLVAIAHVAYVPLVIVTPKNSPYKSFQDLVTAARKSPGTVTYASPGNGTTAHLAAEIIGHAAGIKLLHVPYKGSNAALVDTMAGNVNIMISSVPSALAQIKSGKVRAMAVTSATRSSALPEVPTVAESGYKQVDVSSWYGLFAPAKTPKDVVERIGMEVNKAMAKPAVIHNINEQGAEAKSMSAAEFSQLVQSDYLKWKDIVKASGATVE